MNNPFVISYGGGVNSLAMLLLCAERGVRPDAIVMADTRGEKPPTYHYVHGAPFLAWTASKGFPSITFVCRADFAGERRLRTGDQSLEDECLRLGYMPSRAYGYSTCADKWKLDPFKWWTRKQWPLPAVIMRAIGFDADEAHRIDKTGDPGFAKCYPLVEAGWTREDCEQKILAEGLAVPPKSACYYCPSSTKTEVLALAKEYPVLFQRAVDMEQAALANGKSRIDGLGRHWSWKALVEADEATRAEMQEAPVEGCTQCQIAS